MDDDREKHDCCEMCRDEKLPTAYFCGKNCPANPGAGKLHGVFHKKVRNERKAREDGGVAQQRAREVAEHQDRRAAQTGDKYDALLAEGARYGSDQNTRKAGKAYREAIALRPNRYEAYYYLGAALACISGHRVEASQLYLEAMVRAPGMGHWAEAMAGAFNMLLQEECAEVAKPEWWNDEELKALSSRVVSAAPDDESPNLMRAVVLSGLWGAWEAGPRSAAELKEAAAHLDRCASLSNAPVMIGQLTTLAVRCREQAAAHKA